VVCFVGRRRQQHRKRQESVGRTSYLVRYRGFLELNHRIFCVSDGVFAKVSHLALRQEVRWVLPLFVRRDETRSKRVEAASYLTTEKTFKFDVVS